MTDGKPYNLLSLTLPLYKQVSHPFSKTKKNDSQYILSSVNKVSNKEIVLFCFYMKF